MRTKWNNFKGFFGNPRKTLLTEAEKGNIEGSSLTPFVPTILTVQGKIGGLGKGRQYPKGKVKGKEKE